MLEIEIFDDIQGANDDDVLLGSALMSVKDIGFHSKDGKHALQRHSANLENDNGQEIVEMG